MPLTAAGTALLVASAAHALLIAFTIPLNFKKQYLLGRIWFWCVAGSFMCIYAFVMGSEKKWMYASITYGIAREIQVTESTYQLLQNKYEFDCRGTIEVKGKGLMKTYLLKGSKIR